jgi:hypothetical protein
MAPGVIVEDTIEPSPSLVETSEAGEITDEANFLVTATGHFADLKLPDYPGINEYQSHLRHTGHWDPEFDPTDKRIAVIGNGASGIQVLPQLQKTASHIDHYARNKTWVASPIGGEDLGEFVAENADKAKSSPENYLAFRKALESRLFSRFGGVFKDSVRNNTSREIITGLMTKRLGDRIDLASAIVAEFPPTAGG